MTREIKGKITLRTNSALLNDAMILRANRQDKNKEEMLDELLQSEFRTEIEQLQRIASDFAIAHYHESEDIRRAEWKATLSRL